MCNCQGVLKSVRKRLALRKARTSQLLAILSQFLSSFAVLLPGRRHIDSHTVGKQQGLCWLATQRVGFEWNLRSLGFAMMMWTWISPRHSTPRLLYQTSLCWVELPLTWRLPFSATSGPRSSRRKFERHTRNKSLLSLILRILWYHLCQRLRAFVWARLSLVLIPAFFGRCLRPRANILSV